MHFLYHTINNRESESDLPFRAAAETRRRSIESNKSFNKEKDKVLILPIEDITDVGKKTKDLSTKYSDIYGKTAEVSVWSHAGFDGPAGTMRPAGKPLGARQIDMEEWASFDYNWSENAKMNFFGCNTANEIRIDGQPNGSFVRKLSTKENMKDVEVSGQLGVSYPSMRPDSRSTTLGRMNHNFDVNEPTYFVGGNRGSASAIGSLIWGSSAFPLSTFKNGQLVKREFQEE
jgi:hypothetical protein